MAKQERDHRSNEFSVNPDSNLLFRFLGMLPTPIKVGAFGSVLLVAAACTKGDGDAPMSETSSTVLPPTATEPLPTETPTAEPTLIPEPTAVTLPEMPSQSEIEELVRNAYKGRTFDFPDILHQSYANLESAKFIDNCYSVGQTITIYGGITFEPTHPNYGYAIQGECLLVAEATKTIYDKTGETEALMANQAIRDLFLNIRAQVLPDQINGPITNEARYFIPSSLESD